MTNISVILSTIDQPVRAEEIAALLIQERLASCANILPHLTSIYRWKGQIERAAEHLMIIKTQTDKVPELIERLKALHPYEVPEIISLVVESGSQSYLDWVFEETCSGNDGPIS